jgi:hypothetical protein
VKSFYGSKEHLATDADSELITAVAIPPGNVPDSQVFAPLVDPPARGSHRRQGLQQHGAPPQSGHRLFGKSS